MSLPREQHAHQRLQQLRAKLELDMERKHRAAYWALGARGDRLKNLVAVQVPERAFDIGNVDALWRLQRDSRIMRKPMTRSATINAFWGVPRSFSLERMRTAWHQGRNSG